MQQSEKLGNDIFSTKQGNLKEFYMEKTWKAGKERIYFFEEHLMRASIEHVLCCKESKTKVSEVVIKMKFWWFLVDSFILSFYNLEVILKITEHKKRINVK